MMETQTKTLITVSAIISAGIKTVWECWTTPAHIVKWNNASNDWHTPRAENDLRVGGKFLSRMESRDGRTGFDFTGVYKAVKPMELIEYEIDDGINVRIAFSAGGKGTTVVESFEAESTHTTEQQQGGWQSILNNFKKYVEGIL
jgi:uncharacterized protein YndB with AHSA1/START domain